MSVKETHSSGSYNPDILEREKQFHDQWATDTSLERIPVVESFESPVAMENRFVIQHIGRHLGPLAGKKLLDIGVGLGVSGGEDLPVESNAYDVVCSANTLHHVSDRKRFFEQMHRVLKPGVKFYTIDPLVYNPIITVYRHIATKVRTVDETPLSFRTLRLARECFVNVQHREFWIATLALFLKYYLIDRVHPNEERYWKRIYTETAASLWWWYPLRGVDSVLTRIPLIPALAWNIVMYGEKAAEGAADL